MINGGVYFCWFIFFRFIYGCCWHGIQRLNIPCIHCQSRYLLFMHAVFMAFLFWSSFPLHFQCFQCLLFHGVEAHHLTIFGGIRLHFVVIYCARIKSFVLVVDFFFFSRSCFCCCFVFNSLCVVMRSFFSLLVDIPLEMKKVMETLVAFIIGCCVYYIFAMRF